MLQHMARQVTHVFLMVRAAPAHQRTRAIQDFVAAQMQLQAVQSINPSVCRFILIAGEQLTSNTS